MSLDVFWKWLKTQLLELRSGGHSTSWTQSRKRSVRVIWYLFGMASQGVVHLQNMCVYFYFFYHFSNNLPSVLLNPDLSLICKEKQLINLVVLRTKTVFWTVSFPPCPSLTAVEAAQRVRPISSHSFWHSNQNSMSSSGWSTPKAAFPDSQ